MGRNSCFVNKMRQSKVGKLLVQAQTDDATYCYSIVRATCQS